MKLAAAPVLRLVLPLVFAALAAAESSAPAERKEILAEREPLVRSWKPADFPAALPATVTTGKATLRIVVDEHGAVTAARVLSASDPAFGEAALVALKGWVFSAGVDNGKYAKMCLDVPFEFDRNATAKPGLLPPRHLLPRTPAREPAALRDGPVGDYPPSLAGRGLPGSVLFGCEVDPEGHASNLQIVRASHVDFVLPAIESSSRWTFKPARRGDVTTSSELVGEVSYSDTKTPPRSQVLAVNGISAPDGSAPEASPLPLFLADPVYPYEALLKGEAGSASVEFIVGANGVVRDVRVREASKPEFGAALAAAVETWRFSRAMINGQGVDVPLLKKAEFKAVPLELTTEAEADPQTRLVKLARANAIGGGRGLDQRLSPLYRVLPAVPESAKSGEKVTVTVEFVIDRDGRVRLPRFLNGPSEAYGWSAVTAVSQWVFQAPRRGGQPTDVKVQIPVAF